MKSQNQFFSYQKTKLTHHEEHQIKTKQQQKQLSQYVFKLLHEGAILHNVPKDTIFMRLKKENPWLEVGINGIGAVVSLCAFESSVTSVHAGLRLAQAPPVISTGQFPSLRNGLPTSLLSPTPFLHWSRWGILLEGKPLSSDSDP